MEKFWVKKFLGVNLKKVGCSNKYLCFYLAFRTVFHTKFGFDFPFCL